MLAIFIQTVFSFRSYHRLARLSAWKTAFYGAYLLLVGVLVFNIYFGVQLHKRLPAFLRSFPAVTFVNGRLSAPDKPVTVAVPGTEFSVLFDAGAKNPPSKQEFLNKKLMAFVSGGQIYMPSVAGVQSQPLPEKLNADITPQFLAQHASSIRSVLQSAAFFGSFFAIALFLLFSFCLAGSVVFLWRGLTRIPVETGTAVRWAALLQGPAFALWVVHLLVGVPLFLFGLFIVFMIYTQQIFNTFAQETKR